MIEFSTLKDKLTARLEAIGLSYGLSFYIVSDTGEYKKPDRKDNTVTDYINGVIKLLSSDISNLTDGTVVATQTARLDLAVRLPDLDADEEWNNQVFDSIETKINKVRAILNTLTQESTYEDMTDTEGTAYAVSTIYQSAVTGDRDILTNVGDSFTFSVFIYYILIQGGISTKNAVFNLDGAILPFQAMTMNRAKTYDSNVYSYAPQIGVQNVAIQSNWSVTFELPAIKGDFFDKVLNSLLGLEKINAVHCLSFALGGVEQPFLVTLGDNNLNGETIKNMGLKLTFFNAPLNYYLVSFPESYKTYTQTLQTFSIEFGGAGGFIIAVREDGRMTRTYFEGGKYVTLNTGSSKYQLILASTPFVRSSGLEIV